MNNNDEYGPQGGADEEAGRDVELPPGWERAGKVKGGDSLPLHHLIKAANTATPEKLNHFLITKIKLDPFF